MINENDLGAPDVNIPISSLLACDDIGLVQRIQCTVRSSDPLRASVGLRCQVRDCGSCGVTGQKAMTTS